MHAVRHSDVNYLASTILGDDTIFVGGHRVSLNHVRLGEQHEFGDLAGDERLSKATRKQLNRSSLTN